MGDAPPDGDDKLELLAFRLLYEASEALKDEGLDAAECWALMFATIQDLQAADLGMGSDVHKAEVQAQRDSLDETLATWDDADPEGLH